MRQIDPKPRTVFNCHLIDEQGCKRRRIEKRKERKEKRKENRKVLRSSIEFQG